MRCAVSSPAGHNSRIYLFAKSHQIILSGSESTRFEDVEKPGKVLDSCRQD